jgi:hypothetical protein
MSVETLISVEEYLSTACHPDVEYEDGVLVERNVGDWLHSLVQRNLIVWPDSRLAEKTVTRKDASKAGSVSGLHQRAIGEASPPSVAGAVGLDSKFGEKPADFLRQVDVKQPHSERPGSPMLRASFQGSPREENVRMFPRFLRRSSLRRGRTE